MTSMLIGLVGALLFTVAYAYYLVAGTFSPFGGEAVIALIEFGTVIGGVILAALLMAACLQPGQAAPPANEAPEPAQAKESAPRG